MPEPKRSARRQKIEPLNYADAAMAPALKGMTSFLDVSPEQVRNGSFESFGPNRAGMEIPMVASTPGDETYVRYDTYPANSLEIASRATARPVTPISSKRLQNTYPEVITTPDGETGPISVSNPVVLTTPGDETYRAYSITPGRGRSKVRRCIVAQDGHSLGEEAIYQYLWRTGRPESADPNGSRTKRIGAAELGQSINMAKKNVRQNISRLFEKLAIEILEDFETMSSQARLYRVHSYKQILERRRQAGMLYVLRNKGVIFCTQDGGGVVSSPAYVSSPGDQTLIRPAPPKIRRRLSLSPVPSLPTPITHVIEGSESRDLQVVSQALNRYSTVDHAAAIQLLRDCRRVRSDARGEEIAFFVIEKLDLSRQSRNIMNPTGLVLATVPNSFAGASFEAFRRRMERQAALAEEETARRARERTEMGAWVIKERERNESIVSDSSKSDTERDAAEKLLRRLAEWNP